MLLKKISLNNIRSYEDQEVEFSEGSTLLCGDIGCGKTSILLAIEFALFGLQPGQKGSSLLRNGASQGSVKIDVEIDGKAVSIERVLKRGKSVTQDFCSITQEGVKNEMSVTELKNKILKLLEYPGEFSKKQNILYRFTVYTPQEEMKQIILQDAETRLNTLRHVFGIDKYKKILENIAIISAKIREDKRAKEGMISDLEIDKENLLSRQGELDARKSSLVLFEAELLMKKENRKRIQEEKEELSKKIEEKNKLQQETEKTKIMISSKRETLAINNKSIAQLNEQILELQKTEFDDNKILELESEIKILKSQKEKISEEILKVVSEMASLELKNEDSLKLERKISSLEICPTCLQNVEPVYRANVLNKIHSDSFSNNKKIEDLKVLKTDLSQKLRKAEEDISIKQNQIHAMNILKIKLQDVEEKKKRLEDIEKNNLSLEKDIRLLTEHLDLLRSSILEFHKYENLFESKQKELDVSLAEERKTDIKLAELRKEIEFSLMQIKTLHEKIKRTEEIKSQLNYLNELEGWLSKKFSPLLSFIEKNVMIKLKTEFSKLFTEWFYMLVSDNFNVRLSEDFTPIIEQQDYEIDYEYLSGGERTAIALAYRLSLNQVINSLMSKLKTRDLVILDEPTDGFSEQQLDKMRDVLQQLSVKQLIIVSHEQKIEGFVENIIRFKKDAGVSRKQN
jgi:exonuclease SbcC